MQNKTNETFPRLIDFKWLKKQEAYAYPGSFASIVYRLAQYYAGAGLPLSSCVEHLKSLDTLLYENCTLPASDELAYEFSMLTDGLREIPELTSDAIIEHAYFNPIDLLELRLRLEISEEVRLLSYRESTRDITDAQVVARLPKDLIYLQGHGWRKPRGKVYVEVDKGEVYQMIKRLIPDEITWNTRLNGIYFCAEKLRFESIAGWDSDPLVLNTLSGPVNLSDPSKEVTTKQVSKLCWSRLRFKCLSSSGAYGRSALSTRKQGNGRILPAFGFRFGDGVKR